MQHSILYWFIFLLLDAERILQKIPRAVLMILLRWKGVVLKKMLLIQTHLGKTMMKRGVVSQHSVIF